MPIFEYLCAVFFAINIYNSDMINRLLIRIKTVQLVYANIQSDQPRFTCDEELMASFESSYQLYNYLLGLIVKVTDYRNDQIEAARNKYLPSREERFPNTRFVNNQIAKIIRDNSSIMNYCEEHGLFNDFDTETYRAILDQIEKNPLYMAYMSQPQAPTFEQDLELWKEIFNTIIPSCEVLDATLEDKNIYWNDDLTTIVQFAVKTLSRIKANTEMVKTLGMFRNDDDKNFALSLFHHAIDESHEYLQLIDKTAENWEAKRMAMMEKVIMICALAEIRNFPDIAIRISLNEYIELAKHYCKADSARFINGILDRIVSQWKTEGLIFKAQ